MISDTCRAELIKYGFAQFTTVYICSKCSKAPGEMDRDAPHPLESLLETAIKRSPNPRKDDKVSAIRRRMYNSSRCCAEPFSQVVGDYHELLWERWQSRHNISKQMLDGPPIDGVPNLRIQYGEYSKYVDDDFVLMHYLLGMGDTRVADIIRIFREEDSRTK